MGDGGSVKGGSRRGSWLSVLSTVVGSWEFNGGGMVEFAGGSGDSQMGGGIRKGGIRGNRGGGTDGSLAWGDGVVVVLGWPKDEGSEHVAVIGRSG